MENVSISIHSYKLVEFSFQLILNWKEYREDDKDYSTHENDDTEKKTKRT